MTNQQRFLSLDVFRGMDVCLMIIVNSLGSYETAWSPLLHAEWDGFTLTDLVFPTFLFVVGNAMAFSMGKYEAMGDAAVLRKIIKRTAIIFLLGYLMYWFPFYSINETGEFVFRPISHTRILGVLQRIALCYGIAALIIHYGKSKGAFYFALAALAGYQLILFLFGDLSMLGNIGTTIDKTILGENHMYHGEGVAFEPEGILSTMPSIVNVLAGYLTASYIREKGNSYETIARLMICGAVLLLAAQWLDLFAPINKKLWSSAFVLQTTGLDLLILPVIIFVIEHWGKKSWTPFFEVFGRNTLFIYLLSVVLVISLYWIKIGDSSLYAWIYEHIFSSAGATGSFLFGAWIMLTCWVVGKILDKNGIYIKV